MEKHPYKTITGFEIQLNMSEEEISTKGFKNGGIWFRKTKSIVCGTFPPKKEYLLKLIQYIDEYQTRYGKKESTRR